MALQKRFTTKNGKEIIVKLEKNRYWVKHSEISNQFVTADEALDNYLLKDDEKEFINKAIEEL